MANNQQLALITGSSRGIGKAVAINFAKNGIDVVITGRNESRLKKVKEELNQFDIKSYYIPADLSEENSIENIIDFLTKSNLKVNILINNAAIIHERINLIDFDMKEWQEVILSLIHISEPTRPY